LRETRTTATPRQPVEPIEPGGEARRASVAPDRRSGPGGWPRRLLLLLIALVCVVALLLRRRPQPAARPAPMPSAAGAEPDSPPAEVIPIRRAG
jgi:hypothetical protein